MKQTFFISFLFSIVIGCTETNSPASENQTDSTVTTSIEKDSIATNEDFGADIELFTGKNIAMPTSKVSVVIHAATGYGENESFARMAADTLTAVLNSSGFKRAVVNTNFRYHTNGMSSQQIYDTIMKAHEADGPGGTDGVLDLRLRIITLQEDGARWINACNRSTIGIDGSGTGVSAVCSIGWQALPERRGTHGWRLT